MSLCPWLSHGAPALTGQLCAGVPHVQPSCSTRPCMPELLASARVALLSFHIEMALHIGSRSDVLCFFVWLVLLACPCHCLVAHSNLTLASQGSGSTFMLVAGISATSEMCMTVRGGSVALEPCLAAVAAGDGPRKCFHARRVRDVALRTCVCLCVLRHHDLRMGA